MLHSLGATVTAVLFAVHGWPVYAVIGVLAFCEAALLVGLVLPGETALFLGGVLAAQGNVNLVALLAVAIVAAVAGDSVGYEMGRRLGPAMRQSRLGRRIGPDRWVRADAALEERGALAVVAGRWVGVLRALVPIVAGSAGMPYRRFLVANVLGGAVWAVVVAVAGFAAGAAWQQAQGWLSLVGLAFGIGLAGWAAFEWLAGRRRQRGDHSGASVAAQSPMPRNTVTVGAGAEA